jgi:phage terminase Nu1 subunit (DNA packaging protein)
VAEHAGLIPIGQAARLLMISEERIRQLVKQGYVPKAEKRGFVQLVGAVQGYLRYLKDDERRSAKSAADSRVRDARALEIELRIAERSRELISVEDALSDMAEFAGMVRSELAGLPARLTRVVAERQKVETEIDGILSRLSQRAAEKAEGLEAGRSHPQVRAEAADD